MKQNEQVGRDASFSHCSQHGFQQFVLKVGPQTAELRMRDQILNPFTHMCTRVATKVRSVFGLFSPGDSPI